ncbi:hypothetical protein [Chryseobacterium vaccae]|uniref:hypothetical protein n=1 Tax=Chryseobacterium vaccae TaxID=2604424 RepID=UPI001297FE55|nr:hypothetical protein [Chryseobacterium vaccae]
MLPFEKNFQPLSSIPARGLTVALKVFLLSLFILIMGSLAGMIIFSFWVKELEIKLIILGFSVPVLSFLTWMAIAEYRAKPPKYTQIQVDEKGLHHYGENTLPQSLLYESLFANSEGGAYDVLWTDRGYSESEFDLYIFTKNELDVIKAQPVKFKTTVLVRNPNALFAHFVKGIMYFRPDLKIDPNVLERYHISPHK